VNRATPPNSGWPDSVRTLYARPYTVYGWPKCLGKVPYTQCVRPMLARCCAFQLRNATARLHRVSLLPCEHRETSLNSALAPRNVRKSRLCKPMRVASKCLILRRFSSNSRSPVERSATPSTEANT
jgi:hypothetical protein